MCINIINKGTLSSYPWTAHGRQPFNSVKPSSIFIVSPRFPWTSRMRFLWQHVSKKYLTEVAIAGWIWHHRRHKCSSPWSPWFPTVSVNPSTSASDTKKALFPSKSSLCKGHLCNKVPIARTVFWLSWHLLRPRTCKLGFPIVNADTNASTSWWFRRLTLAKLSSVSDWTPASKCGSPPRPTSLSRGWQSKFKDGRLIARASPRCFRPMRKALR